MTHPTAAELVNQYDDLARKHFKLDQASTPEGNDRGAKALGIGGLAGIGTCFGGSALLISTGVMAQGGVGHYAMFFGGLVLGGAAAALAAWKMTDGPEESAQKAQYVENQLTELVDVMKQHPAAEVNLVDRLAARRANIIAQEEQKLKAKGEMTTAIGGGLLLGAMLGSS